MATEDVVAPPGYRSLTFAVLTDAGGWISSNVLYPERPPWGLAHVSGPLRELRRRHPGLPLVALGDWFTGAPAPEKDVKALADIAQSLGLVAVLPGEGDLRREGDDVQLPWVGSDVASAPGVVTHIPLVVNGVRVNILGLAQPGSGTRAALAHRGVSVQPAIAAVEATLAATENTGPDIRIALVNAASDSAENAATALAEGHGARESLPTLADGSLSVDLIIARGANRRALRSHSDSPTLATTPVVAVAPGLTVVSVALDSISGRWRVVHVTAERVAGSPDPDPKVLRMAGAAWSRTSAWLSQPTRALVSGYNRKAEFIACAGELSHAAVAAMTRDAVDRQHPENPILSLTSQYWRFEPLRKKRRGEPITRGQLYRWMPHDDAMVPAHLTGRQIALLLEPYARARSGWSVSQGLVLYPGGMVPRIEGRATQPASLALAESSAELDAHRRYFVWLPNYHAEGAGGLARRALVTPDQLGQPTALTLREIVFRWMASPDFVVPTSCARFLAVAPGR